MKPGDIVCAVEKGQGLGKGGKIKRLGKIEIISCESEQLRCIEYSYHRNDSQDPRGIATEMSREGFPLLKAAEFVKLFCKLNDCKPDQIVYRIVFKKVK
jgi:hypothetical protein